MQDKLDISESNKRPHLDIEKRIYVKQDGVLSLTLKLNSGIITDFQFNEYVDLFSPQRIAREAANDEVIINLFQKNLSFHQIIEDEIKKTLFGSITCNLQLKDGNVLLNKLSVLKSQRIKYKT